MAPVKYEEQMKDKLEKRSLQPSPEAWASLSNRLNVEQKKKSKSFVWWFGIAASIVGILFVTAMYFTNQPIENDSQIIVDTDENVIKNKEQTNENQIMEVPVQSNEVVVEETKSEEISQKKQISNPSVKTLIAKENSIVEKLPQENVVAQVQEKIQETKNGPSNVEKLTEINNAKLTFEEQKIQDVVAQIKAINSNGKVTATEIDSLLKKAQNEILSNRLYNENTRTVDAKLLLQDVEDDLQQSFRSKVFEALQSGYESVRTAVAERNN